MFTPIQQPQTIWSRAIILVDMDAFFAAVEQRDNPQWRGKPIAVTNGEQGSCIITCSYEARAYGIKTGMRLKEAKVKCPHLLVVPSRPHIYAQTSRKIFEVLQTVTPDIEVFSVDEAFLDVSHCQLLWGTPEKIAQLTKQKVFAASGLFCSIGVSGDKTTAKWAAQQQKPNGLVIVPPWEAKARLQNVPVEELCGIGNGTRRFLYKYGVVTCGDMEKLPIGVLAKRFGNRGRRLWYMCQGADPEPLLTKHAAPKSMGHGKVMPPKTTDKKIILTYLRHMCEKLAARLRRYHMQCQLFFIGWRTQQGFWLGAKPQWQHPIDDGYLLFHMGKTVLEQEWHGEPLQQVQVTALAPIPKNIQGSLFEIAHELHVNLNTVVDAINNKFGEFSIMPAPLLQRSRMHNVIAPAWRPSGHRRTV